MLTEDPWSINLLPAYPEILLVVAVSAILLIDMFLSDARRVVTYVLSLVTIAFCAVVNLAFLIDADTIYTFNNMFVSDPMSNLLKVGTYLAVAMSFVYSREFVIQRGLVSGERGGEFYAIALFALLGQMVMISANNFLSIYLGLELMSLSLYAMCALARDDRAATEASMKYFILGALASGFLLYGMSMVYGATGSLDLTVIARELASGGSSHTIMVFGLVFLVAGLAFKLGVVPFHMWIPDVYQGAPTAVTLMIGGAPKLAAFAITLRILVEGMIVFAVDWQQMLIVLAVLSLALGNIAAIAQTSVKRLLGYSTIAQMGFMLLGLFSGVVGGNAYSAASAYGAAMFYVLTYVVTVLGAFGVLMLLSRAGYEADSMEDLKGLFKRSPVAAGVMLVIMFSLTGIPPTVGFYAKFVVVNAAVVAGQVGLAVFALMMSLIAAYYYLRIVKLMFFDDPVSDVPVAPARLDMRLLLAANGAAVVAFGIVPGWLMQYCLIAITRTLAS
ncbi:MAG: NADH-quinone oxidoreductase subunit NuoN [Burkholderiaceae bacterium]|jgi:NADH-quinone oxidoreductase subunit N